MFEAIAFLLVAQLVAVIGGVAVLLLAARRVAHDYQDPNEFPRFGGDELDPPPYS